MDVMCFLMALEIERMLQENDRLKYQLKEIEDKMLDRQSYEQQIVHLMERVQQLQNQESLYK